MQRPKTTGTVKFVIMMGMAAALASCGGRSPGSFDQTDDVSTRLANLMAFNKLTGQPLPAKEVEKVECPEIIVLDGTAAHRVYNGAEANETLKYQYSLGDIARECIMQGNQVSMRVGIAGQVLLGPMGAPGAFSVPIRVAVVRESDNAPVVSKLYTANVSVVPGQTEASFTIVTEPMLAPFIQQHTADDYTIKVGIDAGGAQPAPAAHSRKNHHPLAR